MCSIMPIQPQLYSGLAVDPHISAAVGVWRGRQTYGARRHGTDRAGRLLPLYLRVGRNQTTEHDEAAAAQDERLHQDGEQHP